MSASAPTGDFSHDGNDEGGRTARCSPIQERYHRAREAHPEAIAALPFRGTLDFLLNGQLDAGAFAESWAAVVRRQWSLRSGFRSEGATVVQTVLPPPPSATLAIHDLRGARDQPKRLHELLCELYAQVHHLPTGVVLHAAMFQLDDLTHRFEMAVDHIAFDGRSAAIIRRELMSLYTALLDDPARSSDTILEPTPRQYVDWSDDLWSLLAGPYGGALREHWSARLDGAIPVSLPVDDHTTEVVGPAALGGGWLPLAWVDPVSHWLERNPNEASGRRSDDLLIHATARPIALLSILFAWLHRLTGQRDLSIAMPTDARPADCLGVVGHFVIPLIIRVQIAEGSPFVDLLRQVRDTFVDAMNWRQAPLYSVIDPPHGTWRVTYNYLKPPSPTRYRGLQLGDVDTIHPRPRYIDTELQWFLREVGDRIHIRVWARAASFRSEMIDRFIAEFTTTAERLLAAPDQPIA